MKSFLDFDISELKGVGKGRSLLLNKIGIFKIKDLITYFPYKYEDTTNLMSIKDFLNSNYEQATVTVKVEYAKNVFTRTKNKSIQRVVLKDNSGQIEVNFFNQPFLINNFLSNKNCFYLFNIKKTKNRRGKIVFYPRSYEKKTTKQLNVGNIAPVYKLTKGISIKWLRMFQKYVLDRLKENNTLYYYDQFFSDLPTKIIDLLSEVHFPQEHQRLWESISLLSQLEIAFIYYNHNKNKKTRKNLPKFYRPDLKNKVQEVANIKFTTDQLSAIDRVIDYFKEGEIFKLMVQGDVGSGKSYVAFFSIIYNFLANRKSALLCPTTILAAQNFEKFMSFAKYFGIKVTKPTKRSQLTSEWDVIIGTTAIYSKIDQDIDLLIIDEQQKFGVFQREGLLDKNNKLSIIELSATPIPRTLISTMYGDIAIQQIKTMPFGQRKVKTYIVPQSKQKDFMNWLRDKLFNGEKVIWVVPAVDSQVVSNIFAEEEFLKINLDNFKISKLFGSMLSKDKESNVEDFKTGKTQILLATSIIEVGIDIPDASIIVIKNPERFGLAQLHQMRGRVGRIGQESYCYMLEGDLVWNSNQKNRLVYFTKTLDGFDIAEYDLKNRGPGEIYGTMQSGIPNTKIANFSDINSIKLGIKMGKEWLEKYSDDINLYNFFDVGSIVR